MGAVKRRSLLAKIALCALILAVFTGNFLFDISEAPRTTYNKLTETGKGTVGELVRRFTVEQEIPYHAGDCGLSIRFATYGRRNLGNVRIRIVGEDSGFVYLDRTDPVYAFDDNQYTDFAFADDLPQQDETLKVTITSTSSKGHALTIWTTDDDALPDCALVINGKEKGYDLAMKSIARSNRTDFAWPILVMCLISIVLSMIVVLNDRIRLENKFPAVALTLGIIYIFVMTPMSIADEQTHYQSAFKMTNVLSFQTEDTLKGEARYFDYHGLSGHFNVGSGYDRVLDELFEAPDADDTEKVAFAGSLGYPLMLLPQSIGLLIGRQLGANFLVAFYLGRLTNLLFYIICVYCAMRTTPRFKLLFFMVGIMPLALHQAASYSYDTFINGMAMLLFAFFLRALGRKGKIRFRDIVYIAIFGTLLAPAKIIYASLLFIMFAVPAKRFADKRQYWLSMATVMGSAALIIALLHLRSILSVSSSAVAPKTNWEGGYNYCIADFFQRPLVVLRVYYLTFRTLIWEWLEQTVGKVLSGQSMFIDQWIVSVYIILLLLSSFSFRGERALTVRERWVFAVASLLPVFLLMFIMLVSWTSNTHDIIQGIQGRYFIPCIPLFFMSLNNRLVRLKKPICKYVIMAGVLLNVFAMQQVMFNTFAL